MLKFNSMKDFGKRLKFLRGQENLSLRGLAKNLNISKSTLFSYESEGVFPSDPEILIKLSNYYGITIDYLITGKEDKIVYIAKLLKTLDEYFNSMCDEKRMNLCTMNKKFVQDDNQKSQDIGFPKKKKGKVI